jgi:AcrR family transcriptional regulator
MTVADVLTEAGLSTRAFYRHFRSRDELVLAVFEHETRRSLERLTAAVYEAPNARAALDAWIDETLALGFEPARARRTRPLAREGNRLQAEFPKEFAAIVASVLDPLVAVLRAFPAADPERDARTLHAIAWALVEEKLHGSKLTVAQARAHILRFCLPAIGAAS